MTKRLLLLLGLALLGVLVWKAVDAAFDPGGEAGPMAAPPVESSPSARAAADGLTPLEATANRASEPERASEASQDTDVWLDASDPPPPDRDGKATLLVTVYEKGSVAPIQGVRLFAFVEEPGVQDALEAPLTDERGRTQLELRPGVRHSVLLQPQENAEETGSAQRRIEALSPAEVRELVVELPRGEDLVFWGRVVSDADGSPIAGARVYGHAESGRSGWAGAIGTDLRTGARAGLGEVEAATADGSGFFELQVRSWKPGTFGVDAPGYGGRTFRPGPGHETVESAAELRLLAGATLHVTLRGLGRWSGEELRLVLSTRTDLLDPEAGLLTGFGFGDEPTWSAPFDSAGTCSLSTLPARAALQVEVRDADGNVVRTHPEHVVLAPGETRELVLYLESGFRIHGKVQDQDGEPVVDRELWLRPYDVEDEHGRTATLFPSPYGVDALTTTSTDEGGRFLFEDVPPGAWWIGVVPSRNRWEDPRPDDVSPKSVLVRVDEDEREPYVELEVYRGLYIRGRVVAPDGLTGIEGAADAFSRGMQLFVGAQCREDGRFRIGPLVPGSYVLTADGFDPWTESLPVEAEAGAEDVVLVLRKGGSVAGRVIGAGDGTARRATLTLSSADGARAITAGTSDDGAFQIGGLIAGTYHLSATSDDDLVGTLTPIEVSEGAATEDLTLLVHPSAGLSVRLEGGASGASLSVFSGEVLIAWDSAASGTVKTFHVPPGPVRIVARVGTTIEEERTVETRQGSTEEVVLAID